MEEVHGVEQPPTIKCGVLRVNLAVVEIVEDEVIVEGRVELNVNGKHYAVFHYSPSGIREMVVGHLLSEGVIRSLREVERLEISRDLVEVQLADKADLSLLRRPSLILTECGGGIISPHLWSRVKRVREDPLMRVGSKAILRAVKALSNQSTVFRRTGGSHASALLDDDARILAFAEDIGRHNALDKVIGKAALEGFNFERAMLASTGRLTSDMVVKAVNVGTPIIASTSAPTDKAIKVAETAYITLIGFSRGKRFNIYAHPERVIEP